MKLKITLIFVFALAYAGQTISLWAQQPQLSPQSYITDSGDTVSLPGNQRNNPFPPPSPLACASSNTLITPYNQNNGQRGLMFDITAINNITINCFEANLQTGTTGVAIYYKVGTHVGFTTTPGAWTLIGTVNVAGAGNNVPTAIPINVNVSVSAGCTVAFYITRTQANGPLLNYTNGTVVGFVFASNPDLQVKDGTGKDYPFAANFTPRRFNGTIFYTQTAGPGGGTVTGPTQVCAGSTLQYTFTGSGWTNYNWTVPAGTTITAGQGTNTITVLAGSTPGNICCTPSGACGPGPQACLAVSLAPSPSSLQSHVNVSCFGGSNGTATITASPAGTYTYAWSPNVGNTATVTGLVAGVYTVTATNNGGCSTTQTISVTEPPVLSATQTQTNVVCNGTNAGAASVTPAGGAGGYTYAWSPSVSNTSLASNLAAGNYSVVITDMNGCTNTQTFNITSPSAIVLVSSSTPSVCGAPNGSASVIASGGDGGYQYAWSPSGGTNATENGLVGGNYVVLVTDVSGCTSQTTINVQGAGTPTATITSAVNILCNGGNNGSATVTPNGGNAPYTYAWTSGGTNATENGLPAGTYTATVTDADGCTATDVVTITEPPLLTAAISGTDVLCFGGTTGTALLTPNGGAGGNTFAWSPSGGNAAGATGLTAQTYTCLVTDMNGCTASASITLTEPAAMTATFSQVDELCNGGNNGSASVTPAGGAGNYSYAWAPSGGNTSTASSLYAGLYTCTITDANGCTLTQSFNITEPAALQISSGTITNVDCYGLSTGAASVNNSGGTGPFTFVWSPNVSTTNSAANIAAGNYTVSVTDANGCSSSVAVTVTEPPLLTLQTTAAPPVICNGQTSQLSANAGGGSPAYNIVWSPGNVQSVTPATTTTYTAVVTDANGCTASATSTVTVNPVPTANFSSNTVAGCAPVCVTFSDVSTIPAPGVITSWNWDFGDGNISSQQNPSHCYNTPGTYTVILEVKSADGCLHTITMTNYIAVFVNPVASFGMSPQPTTIFNSQIYFTDESSNAASWQWSFGDVLNSSSTNQNPTFTYGQPTCYDVVLEVTSSDGCMDDTTRNVCIDPDISVYVPNGFTPNGDGRNDVFTPVTVGIDPGKYEFWIFDRWGNQLYYTTDINAGWDGRMQGEADVCQIDTYVWRIVAWDISGNAHTLTGGISLMR